MNMHSMNRPRHIDTHRAHRTPTNPYKRRPRRRTFDAFEVGGIVALAIGATLMVAIWAKWI